MPDLPMRDVNDDSDIPDVEVLRSEQPKPPRDPETWEPVQRALKEFFEDEEFRYQMWVEPIELVVKRRRELVIAVPRHLMTTVKERYARSVERIASAVLKEPVTVTVVGPEWFPAE